jgi:hypothetical protein
MFGFSLTKWYMDVVTEQGDAAIVYAAQVSLGFVKFQGSAVLLFPSDGHREKDFFSTKSAPVPQLTGESWIWNSPELGVGGRWAAIGGLRTERALGSAGGKTVLWQPMAMGAESQLTGPDGRCLSGLGYVEKLTLQTPPWKLPIQHLHWGRFLNGVESLVWIRWEGADPWTLVYRQGVEVPGARVTEEAIEGAGWRLPLPRDQKRVLREGSLGEEALKQVPAAVRGLLPASALVVHETKWLTRTEGEGIPGGSGWALFENVTLAS